MDGNEAVQLFGVTLVGATPENGRKLLLTLVLVVVVLLLATVERSLLAGTTAQGAGLNRFRFWARQAKA